MKKKNYRVTVTLLMTALIFCLLLLTVLLSTAVMYILLRTGVLSPAADSGSIYYPLIYMALTSLLIGALLTLTVGRATLVPIRKAVKAMRQLAEGDFSVRLKLSRRQEQIPALHDLTESFNKMAEELQNTELLRSDFINNFSHEFKTPIVSIAGFAKLLKRGRLNEVQRAEYLDIIEEESLRLSYMATNVLNLTKIENQQILTDCTEYNLSEQLRASILLLERKWTKKNLTIAPEFSEYRITANEELLKQVWINLLDNAIKFSPAGGTVTVRISAQQENLTVTVGNTGSTIDSENLPKIFNKFYQADESHSSEGNGIGLAIVKRVTELHGGSVTAVSQSDRTVFTVTLPKTQQISKEGSV